MTTLTIATIFVLTQTPGTPSPVRFGIVYHLPDSSADAIPGSYFKGAWQREIRAPGLPVHRQLEGISSDGQRLRVIIDSEDPEHEFAQSQYRVHLVPVVQDASASVLFWDGVLAAHIVPSDHPALEPATASVLLPEARRLVVLALKEADADMVAPHDTVQFESAFVTRPVETPGVEAIEYHAVFKQGERVTDDRASVFFLYSPSDHHIIFANFGHPEWGPDAEHVFQVSPRLFFRIDRDPHLYLLAVCYGAWESRGIWVVFDGQSGRPLTKPLVPLGSRP